MRGGSVFAAIPLAGSRGNRWGAACAARACTPHPAAAGVSRTGTGMWPAFWMLPSEGSTPQCSGCGKYGGWAASGEIDIMEAPNEASKVLGTLHYGGQWPANVWTSGSMPLPSCAAEAAPCFHTYSIEWNQTAVTWFLDGQPYYTVRSSSVAPGGCSHTPWEVDRARPLT